MGEPLRAAVIGAGGGVGRGRHVPAILEAQVLGTARLVAICEPVPAALALVGDQANVAESDRYLDWRDLVARADIDLVTIATPNSLHEPIAIAALEADKHVLCEKPLALSLDGARRMSAAAAASGRQTAVNHRYRWVPAVRYIKEMLDSGELGEIRQLFMNYFNAALLDPTTPIQWRQTRAEGGGVLGDIGSHMIDMALWWLGPIARVRCDLRTFTTERPNNAGGRSPVDVDDAATCQVEFVNGTVGVVNASGLCLGRTNHQRAEVYGTKGSAVYEFDRAGDLGADALQVCLGAAQHRIVGMARAHTLARHAGTPSDPFLEFFAAIQAGDPFPVDFDAAVRVQAVLDAATRSAESDGAWVAVEPTI